MVGFIATNQDEIAIEVEKLVNMCVEQAVNYYVSRYERKKTLVGMREADGRKRGKPPTSDAGGRV